MYKPLQIQVPQTGNAKNPPLNRPSKKKSPPRACTWKIALKCKVKQRKNGKFPSNYKASPIDFETQISLLHKPRPGTSEFYGLRLCKPPRYRHLSITDSFQCPDKILIFFFKKASITSLIRTMDIKSRPQRVNSYKLNLLIADSAVIR